MTNCYSQYVGGCSKNSVISEASVEQGKTHALWEDTVQAALLAGLSMGQGRTHMLQEDAEQTVL
jgi:hypothetical protein